jgi:hypothetical protein
MKSKRSTLAPDRLDKLEAELLAQRETIRTLQLQLWKSGDRCPFATDSPHVHGGSISSDRATLIWRGKAWPIRRGAQRAVMEVLWTMHLANPRMAIDQLTVADRAGLAPDHFRMVKTFAGSGMIGTVIEALGDGWRLWFDARNPRIIPGQSQAIAHDTN